MLSFIKQLLYPAYKSYKKQRKLRQFRKDYQTFRKLDNNKRFLLSGKNIYPFLDDNTANTYFDAHYIYHPAWAARIVKKINPEYHVDISSTLHFCSIVSAFVPIKFYDYRPAPLNIDNLESLHADLTNLSFKSDSIGSLSCMHTIEHIGLGRYGDVLDPEGDIKALSELKRVCAVGGTLLIVVPVGKRKLQFNAQRIYDPREIVGYMDGFRLEKFSLVNDNAEFVDIADIDEAALQNYGCGCYWFIKD